MLMTSRETLHDNMIVLPAQNISVKSINLTSRFLGNIVYSKVRFKITHKGELRQ